MRSLSKDANVQIAANYIVNALRNKFSDIQKMQDKELEKLVSEKMILKMQKKELKSK